jgi:hypothetical protein
MAWASRVIVAVVIAATSPAMGQQAVSVGIEPPAKAKGGGASQTPSSKAQSTALTAPESHSGGPVKLTSEVLTQKISKLKGDIQRIDTHVSAGGSIVKRWAATAEIFAKYAESLSQEELKCSVQRERLKSEQDRGANTFVIKEHENALRDCEGEQQRSNAAKTVYKRQLDGVAEEIVRIEKDVTGMQQIADLRTAQLKKLEIEKQMAAAFGTAEAEIKDFQKRSPTN